MGTDRTYLLEQQYRTAENLQARIAVHERFSTNPQPFPRWVFDRLVLGDRADILEVGCGNGNLWHANRERIPPGWRLTLTDLSPGMIEEARGRLGGLKSRVVYEVADAQALPFTDGSFDAVIANHVLFHVPDRDRALGEVARVLRPGGTVFATTNGADHLRELRRFVREQWSAEFSVENGPAQLERYFRDVEVERFPGSLKVTEVEPLLDFVRSLGASDAVARLAAEAQEAIDAEGSYNVTTSTALLRARKH